MAVRAGGVRMDDYRASVLHRRAGACLRAARCVSFAEALDAARLDPARAEAMLNALLVGVTSFFQDPLVFTVMGKCRARMREHAAEGERP